MCPKSFSWAKNKRKLFFPTGSREDRSWREWHLTIKSCQFSPKGVFITTVLIILCFSCFLSLYCYVKFHYRFKFLVRMSRVDHELARNFTIFVITFFSSRTQILRKSLVRPHDRFHIPTSALLNGTEMTTRLVSLDS